MDEELKNAIEKYQDTDWSGLLRKDLGRHSLEEVKFSFDNVKRIFDEIINYPNLKKLPVEYQDSLKSKLKNFEDFGLRISTQYNNTAERQQWIQEIYNFEKSTWDSLKVVLEYINFIDPSRSSEVESYIKSAKEKASELEKQLKLANELLEGAQAKAKQAEVYKFGNYFSEQAGKNQKAHRINFGMVFVFVLITGFLALSLLKNGSQEVNNFGDIVNYIANQNLLFKLVIISLGGYLIAFFSRNYVAEKHLYTLNIQRQNALDSHKQILNSVLATKSENDKEVSNAILLELTKAIFDTKETGYLKDSKDSSSPTQIVDISKYISR